MRIPLDYYRILSVPIKAVSQQLEQACSDRLLQQPRREFNEYAIEARQALIEKAYQVLSNPDTRTEYDAQFLVNMQPIELLDIVETNEEEQAAEVVAGENDESVKEEEIASDTSEPAIAETVTVNPTIDIPSSQLIGALLIMQELGEYELVLTQGIEYYNSQEFSQFQEQNSEEVNVATKENIILALALAYMEMGREHWHRKEYESAAMSSQLGIDILNQENLFPQVKRELELDLYKLRPYRVLGLISQNPPNSAPRIKGFYLLQDMLVQREGIEGKGEDRSGLSFDQFLCFIQQLRSYLTSTEQKQLFDKENQQDSAISSYLAVYALLGKGFTAKQPELILRAQRKLDNLGEKQDVTWEQAVCALLLGHTEKAIAKVHQTQDTGKLNQILQHAPGNADLLPGMCFYTEKWLREDVLAQFVDLIDNKLTLKEYFAESEVQAYLDKLTPSTVLVTAETASVASSSSTAEISQSEPKRNAIGVLSRWRSIFSEKNSSETVVAENQVIQNAPRASHSATATIERGVKTNGSNSKSKAKSKARHHSSPHRNGQGKKSSRTQKPSISLPLETKQRAVPPSVMYKAQNQAKQKRIAGKKKLDPTTRLKGWLFILSLIFGVGAVGFVMTKLVFNPREQTAKTQISVAIDNPTVELPSKKPVVAKPELTFEEKSQQVIEQWLSSKSAAFGKEYQTAALNSILAEPLLTTWRDRALAYKAGNFYREYQHQVNMRSAKVNPANPNKATVEAEVKELAQHYQSGQLNNAQSYDDNLLVRYQLVRKGERWLIQNAEVLQTL